jgi:hypothetical protein
MANVTLARARYWTLNSPRVVLEGDRKRAHNSGCVASNLGTGTGTREHQGTKLVGKWSNGCGMLSASSTCGRFGAGRSMVRDDGRRAKLGFTSVCYEIPAWGTPIYRCFHYLTCTTRIMTLFYLQFELQKDFPTSFG